MVKQVIRFISDFKVFRGVTSDAESSDRPAEACTPEIIIKIHDLIMSDWRLQVIMCWASPVIGYNHFSPAAEHIKAVSQKLFVVCGPRSVCICYSEIPRSYVVVSSQQSIHEYAAICLEAQNISNKWNIRSEFTPKEARTVPSAGKVMATSFGIDKETSIWKIVQLLQVHGTHHYQIFRKPRCE